MTALPARPDQALVALRPAWREPLVWLVVGIPALTVVAGLLTWWIAAQRADSDVADDHYRRGLAINRVLQRDEAARAQGLKAVIESPAATDHGVVQVRLRGEGPMPEILILNLSHPVQAAQDQHLTLTVQADGSYRTQSGVSWPHAGRWAVSIDTPQWRLSGQAIRLEPGMSLRLPQQSDAAK